MYVYIYIYIVCVCLVVCSSVHFLQKKLLCHCWILSGFCLIPHSWNEGCVAPRSLLLVLLLCCSALGFAAHQVSPQQFCWACICFLGTLLVVQATGKTHTAAMAKYQSLQPQSWEPNIWIAWKVCVLVSLLRRVPSRCFSYCRWGVFAHLHQVDTRHRFTWDVYTRHRFPQDVSSKLCVCPPTFGDHVHADASQTNCFPCLPMQEKTCCKTSSLNCQLPTATQRNSNPQCLHPFSGAWLRFSTLGVSRLGLSVLFFGGASLLLAARRSPS